MLPTHGIKNRIKNPSTARWTAAAVMLVLGASIAWGATSYEIGTLRRMGPGYFPMLLGIALCLISGLLLMGKGDEDGAEKPPVSIRRHGRALLLPLGGILMFAVLIKAAGFIPAILACTILTGLAEPENRLNGLLAIAISVALFAALVFVYALGIPVRLLAI